MWCEAAVTRFLLRLLMLRNMGALWSRRLLWPLPGAACLKRSPSAPPAERDIKIVRPLYSIEVTETETAKFETEISEEDVHGIWKLKGETLHQSAVSGSAPSE